MDEAMKGGCRLRNQSPGWEAGKPLVSVITVVFNSAGLLERTLTSVLGQTYPNIEYIVIDGGSEDGTVDIIRKHEDRIAYWISEPDRGIYDAMNKGLAAATGDFLWFLNAGDLAYRAETLESVFQDRKTKRPRDGETGDGRPETKRPRDGETRDRRPETRDLIFYGDTMVVDADYREIGLRRLRPPEVLNWKSFRKGMLVCHQAILVHRSIAGPYDLKYRHSADFDWVLRALRKAEQKGERRKEKGERRFDTSPLLHSSTPPLFHSSTSHHIINTHQILCAFLDGGHSKQNIPASLRERFDIMRRNYGLVPTALRHIPIIARFVWYYIRNKRF